MDLMLNKNIYTIYFYIHFQQTSYNIHLPNGCIIIAKLNEARMIESYIGEPEIYISQYIYMILPKYTRGKN